MILTIGMIVRDEEKHLTDCLNSLKKLRKLVKSELIIVDTGSKDGTVEIAEQYADHLLHFEWCDDFAAARNEAIRSASGEWYMTIDADEVLKNDADLIEFFTSGQYREYNSATYIQRNFYSQLGGDYSDFPAPRLTKLTPHTRYVGCVHENLSTYGVPIKHLTTFVEHTGYQYENEQHREQKYQRNKALLLKRIGQNPRDLQAYKQLVDMSAKDKTDDIFAYAAECIDLAKEYKNYYVVYSIETMKIANLFSRCVDEYSAYSVKLKTTIANYFRRRKMDEQIDMPQVVACDIEIYAYKLLTCFMDDDRSGLIKAFEVYNQLWHEFHRGEHHTEDYYITSFSYLDKNTYPVTYAFRAYLESYRLDKATLLLEEFGLEEYLSFPMLVEHRIRSELLYCNLARDYSRLRLVLEVFDCDEVINRLLCNEIVATEYKDRLFEVLDECNYKSTPVEMFRAFYSADLSALDTFWGDMNTLPPDCYDAVFMLLVRGGELEAIEDKIDISLIDSRFKVSAFQKEYQEALISYSLLDRLGDFSPNSLLILIKQCESVFAYGGEPQDKNLYMIYCVIVDTYFRKLGLDPFFTEIGHYPENMYFAYYSNLSLYYYTTNQRREYVDVLKKSLDTHPIMHGIIRAALSFVDDIAMPNEFEMLTNNIKYRIVTAYKAGNIEVAKEILRSYEEINPDDEDIQYMKSILLTVE